MNTELLDLIWHYCKEEKLTKTMDALHRTNNIAYPNLIQLFERHFDITQPQELSFTFKLNREKSNLRKRISEMESKKRNSTQKKMKVEVKKERKQKIEPVPEYFLQLLDELGLKRKDAKTLFVNKEKWVYEKSDRKIFCAQVRLL